MCGSKHMSSTVNDIETVLCICVLYKDVEETSIMVLSPRGMLFVIRKPTVLLHIFSFTTSPPPKKKKYCPDTSYLRVQVCLGFLLKVLHFNIIYQKVWWTGIQIHTSSTILMPKQHATQVISCCKILWKKTYFSPSLLITDSQILSTREWLVWGEGVTRHSWRTFFFTGGMIT